MARYEAKIIGPGGSCVDTRRFISTSDEEATRIAVKFVPSLDVELWRNGNVVGRLASSQQRASQALSSAAE
jgi:hypothetical protein